MELFNGNSLFFGKLIRLSETLFTPQVKQHRNLFGARTSLTRTVYDTDYDAAAAFSLESEGTSRQVAAEGQFPMLCPPLLALLIH